MTKKVATTIVTAKIEVLGNAPLFKTCTTLPLSLHEAFCLYIHEGDVDAGEWLDNYVVDFGADIMKNTPVEEGTLEIDELDHVLKIHGPFVE